MQDKLELKIDWANHEAAKYACENWHYSKVIPVGKLVKVGAWESGKFIGCVIFGRGANNNMLKPFGLNADEGCELVRIALRKHETPVSKILSFALKFLKKQSPELRLVVSYADADQNHHGGIYQATNWIYDGLKNANTMGAFIINGKKTHPKSVHSKGIKQTILAVKKHLDPNATIFYTKGKHRYLMPLDKEMSAKIASLAKPYPKRIDMRVKKQDSEHPSELGGAVPTDTLHSLQQGENNV
jgi:hypothetical protein